MTRRGDAGDGQAKGTTSIPVLVIRQTYRRYLQPFCPADTVFAAIIACAGNRQLLQNPAHGQCHTFSLVGMPAIHTVPSSGKLAEVRWKRGGQSHGAASTELSGVFAGNRYSSSKFHPSLRRGPWRCPGQYINLPSAGNRGLSKYYSSASVRVR
jgi:hypothetical protein